MKKVSIVLLLFFVSFFSCTKNLCSCDPAPKNEFKAVVIEQNNLDCQRPLIQIEFSDTAFFRAATGLSGDLFVVNQLPPALKINGQKLFISPGRFGVGEDFTCTTIGPTYTHLKIITAIAR